SPVNKITCLLKLSRKEKCCRNVHTLSADALLIAAARGDLIGPKRQATRVGLTIQKVEILLPHERIRITNRARRRCGCRSRWRRIDRDEIGRACVGKWGD